MNLWKPDKYFITYDIETVETPYEYEINEEEGEEKEIKKTKILSILSTLSIATSYYMKKRSIYGSVINGEDEIITTSQNIKKHGPDFMKIWMRELREKLKVFIVIIYIMMRMVI
jgi:CRISPR/Cas system-associated protein endoribonuclease Cas2